MPRTREFTDPLPRRPRTTLCHSCGGENQYRPSFPRRRESTIAAHAGIHRPTTPTPEKNTPSFPRRRKSTPPLVIPAKAGIHNCRARGNSSSHYPDAREKHSVIPAEARINTVRHSREGGNPQLPRTREFTDPLPDAREKYSVIPAFAGMTLIFPEPVGTSTDGSGIAGTEIPGWPALCK